MEARVSKAVTKKVEGKMSKMSKDITDRNKKLQDKINSVSDNLKWTEDRTIFRINEALGDEIDSMRQMVGRIENALDNSSEGENYKTASQTNFVIRNLIEREREEITYKVNRLLKDGLKLREIEVQSAKRKEGRAYNGNQLNQAKADIQ